MKLLLEKFPKDAIHEIYSYLDSNVDNLRQSCRFFKKSVDGYIPTIIVNLLQKECGYYVTKVKHFHDHRLLKIINILINNQWFLYDRAIHNLEDILTQYAMGLFDLVNDFLQYSDNANLFKKVQTYVNEAPEELLLLLSKFYFSLYLATELPAEFLSDDQVRNYQRRNYWLKMAHSYVQLLLILNNNNEAENFKKLERRALNNKIVIDKLYLAISYYVTKTPFSNELNEKPLPGFYNTLLALRDWLNTEKCFEKRKLRIINELDLSKTQLVQDEQFQNTFNYFLQAQLDLPPEMGAGISPCNIDKAVKHLSFQNLNHFNWVMKYPLTFSDELQYPTPESLLSLYLIKLQSTESVESYLSELAEKSVTNLYLNLVVAEKYFNQHLIENLIKRKFIFENFSTNAVFEILKYPNSAWLLDHFLFELIRNKSSLQYFVYPGWQKYKDQIVENLESLQRISLPGSFSERASKELFDLIEAGFFTFDDVIRSKAAQTYYLNLVQDNAISYLLTVPEVKQKLTKFIKIYKKKFHFPNIPTLKRLAELDHAAINKICHFFKSMSVKIKAAIKMEFSKHLYQIIDLILDDARKAQVEKLISYASSADINVLHFARFINNIDQDWVLLLTNEEISNANPQGLDKLSTLDSETQKKVALWARAQAQDEKGFKLNVGAIELLCLSFKQSYEYRYKELQEQCAMKRTNIGELEIKLRALMKKYSELVKDDKQNKGALDDVESTQQNKRRRTT